MCCWCVRVYWTVLQNLFARLCNNLLEQNCEYRQRGCSVCSCCGCGAAYQRQSGNVDKQVLDSDDDDDQSITNKIESQAPTHAYVIVEDAEAHYAEIEQRNIETEPYYFTVNREMAENMLTDHEDGACLVRPFKDTDLNIKYVVSIYAGQQYYHLFIRQIDGRQRYCIGQEKPNEQYFPSPCDIIEFYERNPLLCINKQQSQCIVLKPISWA